LIAIIFSSNSPASAAVLPPGFADTVVISGLNTPTAVRFAPDGRIFVAEKRGVVKVFSSFTDTAPRTVIDLSSSVDDYSDRGLLGLALPPDFATNPAVYVLYTRDALPGGNTPKWNDDCPTPPGENTDGCVVTGRLSRLPLSGDVATSEQVLLTGWCQQYPSHSIGNLDFDSTGALIVSGGDGASFTGVDYGQLGATYAGDQANPCGDPPGGAGVALTPPTAEGGALRSQSLLRTSAPAVLNGSILRLNRLTGAAMPDNPFAGSPDPIRARIIASGLRNPFRFEVRPGTNEVWLGDVGWNTTEEINRIPSTTDSVVENFGWPCYEGTVPQSAYQAVGLNDCNTLYNTAGSVAAPFFRYPHTAQVVPNDGCPTGGSSVSGIAFNTGSVYPAAYQNAMFFADYSRNCIWAIGADANGNPDLTKISVLMSGGGGPVDIEMGPGGLLYYVGIIDGAIHRIDTGVAPPPNTITYLSTLPWNSMTNGWGPVELDTNVGGLAAGDGGPIMIAGVLYNRGLGMHAVADVRYTIPTGCNTFSAVVGLDDSAGINGSVVYSVLLDGVQAYASPRVTGASAAVSFSVPLGSAHELGLLVSNGGDNIDYDHADWGDTKLTCGTEPPPPPPTNQPPVPTIATPSGTLTWQVGQQINFSGSATDPETGALPASALVWKLLQHHCPDASCHTHFVQEWDGISSGSLITADIDYPGWYELTLTATDPGGATGTASVTLNPKTVKLTFNSDPRGVLLSVGSSTSKTPFTRTVIQGSANTVSAPSPQKVQGKQYSFVSWSDGGAQSHTITAQANATYVATYRK
jgi:glucose/arabinose dehydrogenase